MAESYGFRKRRNDADNITNVRQKNVYNILTYYLQTMNMSMEDFAKIPPIVSKSTLINLGSPKYGRVPTVNTLRDFAKKISTALNKDAETIFQQFRKAAGYGDEWRLADTVKTPKLKKEIPEPLCLTLTEYQQLKTELMRANTTIEQIFKVAKVQNGALAWNSEDIENILKMAYPNMYIKVLNSK